MVKMRTKTKMVKKIGPRLEPKISKPAWNGPCSSSSQGGITQSLLGGYLVCEERFRVSTVEGLRPARRFTHAIEYGNMWHECEEALAKGVEWLPVLKAYCQKLVKQYKTQQVEVEKWYNVCKVQFPSYVKYWSKHKDVKKRTPLLQEETFNIPYELPSGRTVYLRGKWDSVDYIGKGNNAKIWLQENKTKGEIVEHQIVNQLGFDLQTMLYLVALKTYATDIKDSLPMSTPIEGVRYNVIRRPLSGGKGSIKPKQATKNKPAETLPEYYNRLKEDVIEADPDYWFMRWESKVSEKDIDNFKQQFLHPVLENLCDDYEWWIHPRHKKDPWNYEARAKLFPKHTRRNYRLPYGVYNSLAKTGGTYLDDYLDNGNKVGLEVVKNLFPELEE